MKRKHSKKQIVLEIVLGILAILIVVWYAQKHAPNLLHLLETGNISGIDDYLNHYGAEGKYLLVLLQAIETISIVLPATPVYICSGIMFGKLKGVLVCYVTNLILNLVIFLVAKKIEIGTGHSAHIENQKFIDKLVATAKHMDRVVLAMCLLPIVPNGMIPYLSAQTKLTTGEFMKALAIGSFPSILVYVCCGDILISDSYKIILPVIIVLAVLSVIAFFFRKQLTNTLEPKLKAFFEG